MKIEFFFTPGCGKCGSERDALKAEAEALLPNVEWQDIDVLESFDRAVARGVLTLPALAIDGDLVCPKLPTLARWHRILRARAEEVA